MSKPVVLVTGASQGIGAVVAESFARETHARVALLARSEARLEEVADRCQRLGGDAGVFPCDVADPAAVARASADVQNAFGLPDVIVNNAGQFVPGSVTETTSDEFRQQVEVNLNSAFYVTQEFLAGMMERGSGDLFFMASVASIKAYPGGVAYCAAKHGLLGLARAVREETKGTGVRSTAIILGATLTPSWDGVEMAADRFIPPEDVAETILSIYRRTGRTNVEEILIRPRDGDI
ncbi:MAG: SDR family oxidoreductase [Rhodothermales bacterium]|nr:SDR family oxidoreductase [Rhodothermales bacterium]